MDPLTIAALVSGGLKVAKGLFGAGQTISANRQLRDLRKNRPIYETPESATKALGLAEQMSRSDMPGMDYAESKLGRATAAGARRVGQMAGSTSQALGAMTDIYGRQLDAERELAYQNALYRQQAMMNYQGQLGQMAQYEDQAFNINKWMPYQTQMNELMDKRNAGVQNLWSGIEGAAGVGMSYMGTKAQIDAMKSM